MVVKYRMDKFLFKRGNQAKLPQLQTGEPFLSKDEERLYIGGNNGNIPLPNKQDMDEVTTQLAQTETEINQITTQLAEKVSQGQFNGVTEQLDKKTEQLNNNLQKSNRIIEFVSNRYRYLITTFNNTRMKLILMGSYDGEHFNIIAKDIYTPTLGNKTLRDPVLIPLGNDEVLLMHTAIDWGIGSIVGVATTKDFINYTELPQLQIGNFTRIWAPAFYKEGGQIYIIVNGSMGTGDAVFRPYICKYNPLTHSVDGLTEITGTNLPPDIIDAHIYKKDEKYYMIYKNEDTKLIEIAVSTQLTSGYTVIKSGDWAGWGHTFEGNALIQLPNGKWRLYMDDYSSDGIYYSDSETDDILGNWSPVQLIQKDTNESIRHIDIYNLHELVSTLSEPPKVLMNTSNLRKSKLPNGVLSTLKAEKDTLYYGEGSDVITVQSIDTSLLQTGDKIYFSMNSNFGKSSLTIKKHKNFIVPYDIILSNLYGTHEQVVEFVYDGIDVRLVSNPPIYKPTGGRLTTDVLWPVPNGVYLLQGPDQVTVKTIHHESLQTGDKVYFVIATDQAGAKITFSKNNLVNSKVFLYTSGDFIAGVDNGYAEAVIEFVKVGGDLRLVKNA